MTLGIDDPLLIEDAGPADADTVRALFREYAAWLGPEGWFTDLEAELDALPGGYEAILLATRRARPSVAWPSSDCPRGAGV